MRSKSLAVSRYSIRTGRPGMTVRIDGEEPTVPADTFLNVPKGAKRQFHNASNKDAEMIFWFAPAGIQGLFEEFGEHPEYIVAIGEKYGVEYFFDD